MAQLNFAGEYKVTDLKLMTSSGNVVELGATYLAIDLYEDKKLGTEKCKLFSF